nr:hypothetical protein [Candidatus Sigynarchaeota archaeon]
MVFVPTKDFLVIVATAFKEIINDKQPRMTVIQKYRDVFKNHDRVVQEKLFKYIQLGLKHHVFLEYISSFCKMDAVFKLNEQYKKEFINIAILCHLLIHFLENKNKDRLDRVILDDIRSNADALKLKNQFDIDAWGRFIRCLLAGRWTENQNNVSDHAWLSIRYSHPQYMVKRLINVVGIGRTKIFLEHHQQEERFFLLAKDGETSARARNFLKLRGFVFQNDRVFTDLIHVPGVPGWKHDVITKLVGKHDDVIMQDLGSVAVVEALGVKGGDLVLDVCAAPFQKTLAISWKCKNNGKILAIDRHQARTYGNLKRTGLRQNWHLILADSTMIDRVIRELVPDKVLIDAPCSGSGSIAAHPELKFLQDSDTIQHFSTIQRNICASVIATARKREWKNTEIVFSTCSYYPEEGEEIIDFFKKEIILIDLHDPHTSTIAKANFSPGWKGFTCSTKVMRTLPDRDDSRA